jgi:hypothetical protein
MDKADEYINKLAKDIVENAITISSEQILLTEHMKCSKKSLTPIIEEMNMVLESTNEIEVINEENSLIDVSLDDEIDLVSIIKDIKREKEMREKDINKHNCGKNAMLKMFCCCCKF